MYLNIIHTEMKIDLYRILLFPVSGSLKVNSIVYDFN